MKNIKLKKSGNNYQLSDNEYSESVSLQKEECEFGYRSGKVVYLSNDSKFKIVVEEIYEFDE